MAFIETGAAGDAPNYRRAFALRPAVYAAWNALNEAIKAEADLRRHEIASVAAARRLGSSYCTLAHGKVLAEEHLGADAVRALVADPPTAGLDPADQAVFDFAEKVAADATAVTQDDVDGLRAHGLSDAQILDVILAAAARAFLTKVLDAAGAQPDAHFHDLDPAFREALTVGRPIEGSEGSTGTPSGRPASR